jgi:aspartate racemase
MSPLVLIDVADIETTAHYARLIGEEVRHRLFGERRAPLTAVSLQAVGIFDHPNGHEADGAPRAPREIVEAVKFARTLGAEALVLCSSPLNVVAGRIEALPVISMTAPVVDGLRRAKTSRVGLIGTRAREEEQFWQQSLLELGQIESLLPLASDRRHLLGLIDKEFSRGIVNEAARAEVLRVVHSLRQAGARAVVVCTPELTEVLRDAVPLLPVFDVTELHALAAVDWMTRSDPAESASSLR